MKQIQDRRIRLCVIAIIAAGDLAVFVGFVFLGKAEHGMVHGGALVRTALPFAIVWFVSSPWLGVYNSSTILDSKRTVWKVPVIWVLCGSLALLIRAILSDRPLTLAFSLVSIVVQGGLLLCWRSVFIMAFCWLRRP